MQNFTHYLNAIVVKPKQFQFLSQDRGTQKFPALANMQSHLDLQEFDQFQKQKFIPYTYENILHRIDDAVASYEDMLPLITYSNYPVRNREKAPKTNPFKFEHQMEDTIIHQVMKRICCSIDNQKQKYNQQEKNKIPHKLILGSEICLNSNQIKILMNQFSMGLEVLEKVTQICINFFQIRIKFIGDVLNIMSITGFYKKIYSKNRIRKD